MQDLEKYSSKKKAGKYILLLVVIYLVLVLVLMFYWDSEPDQFNVEQVASQRVSAEAELVTGYITTSTLIRVMDTVLDKRGGYLSNDISPPGVIMDNIPNWEFGVITQVRDFARAFRNDFSRSQTQSTEDTDLVVADPQFHFDTESWILPATESEYRTGLKAMYRYMQRLSDRSEQDAQFFARADNLRDWLAIVEKPQSAFGVIGIDFERRRIRQSEFEQITVSGDLNAVGHRERVQETNIVFAARGGTGDGNPHSGPERIVFRPASALQRGRRGQFAAPRNRIAVVSLDVKVDIGVWIDELQIRYQTNQFDRRIPVEMRRRGMMGTERGNACDGKHGDCT